jgi:hypothetical protein
MLYFFSFCCLIGKQTKDELLFATNLLIKSMDKFIKQYKFIIYTNFDLDLHIQNSNVEIRKYYNHKENELLYGNNQWKNLSMNKLFIYKDLYDEFKIDYTWIDLDTYIYHDLSYIEHLDNCFLEYGGEFKKLDVVSNNFNIEFHRYIQGNFWKLNINLYMKLIELLNTLKINGIKLEYDSQSLFTYYFYNILNGNLQNMNINILGNNIYHNTLNGIAIWCEKNKGSHANLDGLNNLFLDKNILRSKFHENKEIHIVSFTFNSLMIIKNNIVFNKLFN